MTFFQLFPGLFLFLAVYFVLTISLLIYLFIKKRYKSLFIYGIILIFAGVILMVPSFVVIRQLAEAADPNKTAKPLAKLIVNIAEHFTSKTGAEKDKFLVFWVSSFLYSTLFYGFLLIPFGLITSLFAMKLINKNKKNNSESDVVSEPVSQ